MNTTYWAIVIGLLVLQLVVSVLAWCHLARRTRIVVAAWQRAASSDVPTSKLVTSMSSIEARLQQLEDARLQPSPTSAGGDAYQLAQRMARHGVAAAQIAEACGITLREAELLAHLHNAVQPADAAPQ